MEFVPLRNLQRGVPEVWQKLRQENGRVVLTNKGQPAYLLVDLTGYNIISLISWLDYYRANLEPMSNDQILPQEQRDAAKRFLKTVQGIQNARLGAEDEAAIARLESGKYRASFSRELDL